MCPVSLHAVTTGAGGSMQLQNIVHFCAMTTFLKFNFLSNILGEELL